jgi:hypothetical protein
LGCIKRGIRKCQNFTSRVLADSLTDYCVFFYVYQEKGRSEDKTKRSGKQAKNAKVEKNQRT